MAIGLFILSQKKRQVLSTVFITLCVLQIIVGCGMTCSSLYVIIAVAPILHTEKSEVNFVFVVTGLYGTHVIFHWIVGINISHRCLKQAGRKSTSNLFLLWTCLGTNTIIQLLILSYYARKINRYITRSIKQSITTGMNQYLQDISWKETIDKLQYSNECCGLTSYEDWHETKWLTKYHVDVNSNKVKELRTNDQILTLPITPWSCCKISFPMQCLHDPLQQSEYAHIWLEEPNIIIESINAKGCLEILRKPISWVIKLFVVSSAILCVIHIVIFILSRILYTSARNAILLGDPDGMSPGWIFGRGDCKYSGGKSVIEIMNDYQNVELRDDYIQQSLETNNKKVRFTGVGLFKRKVPNLCKKRKPKEAHQDSDSESAEELVSQINLASERNENLNDSNETKTGSLLNEVLIDYIFDQKKSLIEDINKKDISEVDNVTNKFERPRRPKKRPRPKELNAVTSGEDTGSRSLIDELKRLQQ